MVFIDKSTQHSQESKQRLEDWKKDFSYNGETLEQLYVKAESGVLTGRAIWTIFRTQGIDVQDRLREDLSIEQEYICCYCGQKLKIDTRIEHFLSKAKEFAKRLFNYDNLLLSCEGELYDRVRYSAGKLETRKEFADRNKLTTKQIKEYNPNKKFKAGERFRCGKDHCDPHKGHIEDKEKEKSLL
jgi:uncharacterized protein (TIGR02646 family)